MKGFPASTAKLRILPLNRKNDGGYLSDSIGKYPSLVL